MKAELAKRRYVGRSLSSEAVEVIGGALQKLNKDNNLTPQALVDAARSSRSPLHKYFEWDDTRAAEKYRLVQARTYMQKIYVEYSTKSAPPVTFRAFQPTYVNGLGKQWKPTLEIAASKEGLEELLDKARADLKHFREKYTALRAYARARGVLTAIDDFVSS